MPYNANQDNLGEDLNIFNLTIFESFCDTYPVNPPDMTMAIISIIKATDQ